MRVLRVVAAVPVLLFVLLAGAAPAQAAPASQAAAAQVGPTTTTPPGARGQSSEPASINLDPGDVTKKPDQAIVLVVVLTLVAVAPSLLLMTTAFTRILIVLGLVRNGLGLPTIPPNQVLAGLALILTAFVMWPTWTVVNKTAVQPYSKGEISASQAFERGTVPVKTWMLKQTGKDSLAVFIKMSGEKRPAKAEDTPLQVVLPAFVISELKTGFTIGLVVLVSFLAIDLIVTSVLMSLGMMMVPPTIVALPLKILVFVLANGWVLVTGALVGGFR